MSAPEEADPAWIRIGRMGYGLALTVFGTLVVASAVRFSDATASVAAFVLPTKAGGLPLVVIACGMAYSSATLFARLYNQRPNRPQLR
ncbi:MAG: hypothetical protein AAGA56_14265 [Myxococcota bacterium]